jgi:hypothetical protein
MRVRSDQAVHQELLYLAGNSDEAANVRVCARKGASPENMDTWSYSRTPLLTFVNKFLPSPEALLIYCRGFRRENPLRARAHTLPSRNSSVQQDWSSWLPPAKAETFDSCVRQLEISYGMFSISLNEALELRRIGKLAQSCRAVFVTPALCARLARPVEGLLHMLGEHAKHFGIIPNTAPLDAANFRGIREQRTARMNDLLSHLLLTQRSQFLHKVDALEEMVLSIRKDFCEVASDLGSGVSAAPSLDWHALDDAHFDLNTCLREAIVLLKSFILVLPDDQVGAFQKSINAQVLAPRDAAPTQRRRMVLIEGQ